MASPLQKTVGLSDAVEPDDEPLRAVSRRASERLLVERMTAGEAAAFDEFAETYLPALHRFAGHRLGHDRELVLDIVQTTAVRVIEKIDTFRGECALMTWLCACCRREIAAHFRNLGRRPRPVEFDDEQPPTEVDGPSRPDGPERSALRRESGELVHIALDLLPEHYGRALEWKYLEDLPVIEIAQRLGVGPKAAESTLTRAREAFRDTYAGLFAAPVSGPAR